MAPFSWNWLKILRNIRKNLQFRLVHMFSIVLKKLWKIQIDDREAEISSEETLVGNLVVLANPEISSSEISSSEKLSYWLELTARLEIEDTIIIIQWFIFLNEILISFNLTPKLSRKVNWMHSTHQDAYWATGCFQSWTILMVCVYFTPRSFHPRENLQHGKTLLKIHTILGDP